MHSFPYSLKQFWCGIANWTQVMVGVARYETMNKLTINSHRLGSTAAGSSFFPLKAIVRYHVTVRTDI